MNHRDTMLDLIHNQAASNYVPAAFFMHFDPAYHQGQAAVDKQLEFFRSTGMDFIKIQYEQVQPSYPPIHKPEDWLHVPLVGEDFFARRPGQGRRKRCPRAHDRLFALYVGHPS